MNCFDDANCDISCTESYSCNNLDFICNINEDNNCNLYCVDDSTSISCINTMYNDLDCTANLLPNLLDDESNLRTVLYILCA